MGIAGVPSSPAAAAPCALVTGSSTCVATQSRRRTPNKPRLQATARSANLTVSVWRGTVSVCTRDLLDVDMLRTKTPAQLIDGFQAPQAGRAGKNVDVHRARFG